MGYVSSILIETIHQMKNKSNYSACLLLEEVGASVISLSCIKNGCWSLRLRFHEKSIHAFNNTASAVLKTSIHSFFLLWRLSNETVSVVCVHLFSGICGFICPHLSISVYVCLFVSVCTCVWVAFIMQWCIYLPLELGFCVVSSFYCLLEQIEGVTLSSVDTIFSGVIKSRSILFKYIQQFAVSQTHAWRNLIYWSRAYEQKRFWFCAFLGLSSDFLSP